MSNITAPSDSETVAFEPSRDRQDIADMNADAAIENGPPLADVPYGAGMSQAQARERLDPIVAEGIEDDRLGDEIAFDGQRQDAKDAVDAKVNSEIVRRGQVRSEFNHGEEQFAGQVEDYAEVVHDPDLNVSPTLAKEIQTSPDGARLIYNLATDPARLDRVSDMTDPVLIRRELDSVRQDMGLPARDKHTAAPAPVPTLSGRGAAMRPDIEKMSPDEYAAGRRSGKIK